MSRRAGASGGDLERAFLLEAHYYDGGLRVRPLEEGHPRPPWVPPSDYVGFRNEITLERDDAAVEFARFNYNGQRVTWIGVFKRSVDQVFGDRKNHAGAGVWLLDADVVDAVHLLDGLQQFAAVVAEGKVDKTVEDAKVFSGAKYLQSYLGQAKGLPSQLGGWPYSATAMAEGALFLATGRDPCEAWDTAAEQILRMTYLPSPKKRCSRAIILVRPAPLTGDLRPRDGNLISVKRGLISELLFLLPTVLDEISEQDRTLTAQVTSLSEQLRESESVKGNAVDTTEKLKHRVAELESQLSDSAVIRNLSTLESNVRSLTQGIKHVEAMVHDTMIGVNRLQSSSEQARPFPGHYAPFGEPAPAGRPHGHGRVVNRGFWSWFGWTGVVITACVVFIITIGLFLWSSGPSDTEPQGADVDQVSPSSLNPSLTSQNSLEAAGGNAGDQDFGLDPNLNALRPNDDSSKAANRQPPRQK